MSMELRFDTNKTGLRVQKGAEAGGPQPRPFQKLGYAVAPLNELCAQQVNGYDLVRRKSFETLDIARLATLLEVSFGKKLADPEGYFNADDVICVIVEKDYRGAAVVKDLDGVPYLDKLAVIPELKGNGLGGSLWKLLGSEFHTLIWRAYKDNPINPWYEAKSTGHAATGEWNVYWYGMSDHAAEGMVEKIGGLPKSLIKVE